MNHQFRQLNHQHDSKIMFAASRLLRSAAASAAAPASKAPAKAAKAPATAKRNFPAAAAAAKKPAAPVVPPLYKGLVHGDHAAAPAAATSAVAGRDTAYVAQRRAYEAHLHTLRKAVRGFIRLFLYFNVLPNFFFYTYAVYQANRGAEGGGGQGGGAQALAAQDGVDGPARGQGAGVGRAAGMAPQAARRHRRGEGRRPRRRPGRLHRERCRGGGPLLQARCRPDRPAVRFVSLFQCIFPLIRRLARSSFMVPTGEENLAALVSALVDKPASHNTRLPVPGRSS
jgi:hypothetical protein